MRKFPLLIIIAFLWGCKTSSVTFFDTGNRATYKDEDWNTAFYENCDVPKSSIKWVQEGDERFLRFTLKNKQIGGCRSDAAARHRAPYWERAEIKQASTLKDDADYGLTFRMRLVKGFTHEREAFFQMHQSVKGCRAGPPLMFKFQNGRFKGSVHVNDVIGKWVDVRMEFNIKKSRYDLYFDGGKIVADGYFSVASCGEPHFKFGIYRPGDRGEVGERISVLDIDKIQLVEMKK